MSTPHKESAPPASAGPCPCGTGKTFGQCCEPLLKGERHAETAEQLMRSRYCAHVARNWEYLHRTFAETAREPYVPEPEAHGRDWTRLVIHAHEAGVKPDMAFVDFTAYYQEGDHEQALHEKAEFRKADGTWLYTRPVREGPPPVKVTSPKVGRNDPCPCGSGKKYKQCCLK